METVADMIPDISAFVGENGACNFSIAFQAINAARRLVWDKSDYKECCSYLCICCADECVTLPSQLKTVRLAWAGNQPISIGNEWYQSVPQIGLSGNGGRYSESNSCHKKLIRIGGTHTTFREYYSNPYYIWLQAENDLDAGAIMTVTARDKYSTWKSESIELQTAPLYGKSIGSYVATGNVVKPITNGRVRLYAWDPLLNARLLLAIYQPYDKNPSFTRYKLQGYKKNLMVYAKRKYRDLVNDYDLVEFPTDAMIYAVQAIAYRKSREMSLFKLNLDLAIAEINRETADEEEVVGGPMRIFGGPDIDNLTPNVSADNWGYGYSNFN